MLGLHRIGTISRSKTEAIRHRFRERGPERAGILAKGDQWLLSTWQERLPTSCLEQVRHCTIVRGAEASSGWRNQTDGLPGLRLPCGGGACRIISYAPSRRRWKRAGANRRKRSRRWTGRRPALRSGGSSRHHRTSERLSTELRCSAAVRRPEILPEQDTGNEGSSSAVDTGVLIPEPHHRRRSPPRSRAASRQDSPRWPPEGWPSQFRFHRSAPSRSCSGHHPLGRPHSEETPMPLPPLRAFRWSGTSRSCPVAGATSADARNWGWRRC